MGLTLGQGDELEDFLEFILSSFASLLLIQDSDLVSIIQALKAE